MRRAGIGVSGNGGEVKLSDLLDARAHAERVALALEHLVEQHGRSLPRDQPQRRAASPSIADGNAGPSASQLTEPHLPDIPPDYCGNAGLGVSVASNTGGSLPSSRPLSFQRGEGGDEQGGGISRKTTQDSAVESRRVEWFALQHQLERMQAAQAATVALLNRAMMGGHNASRKASYESGRPGHSDLVAAVQHAQREAQVQTASIAGGSQDTYTPQSMCTPVPSPYVQSNLGCTPTLAATPGEGSTRQGSTELEQLGAALLDVSSRDIVSLDLGEHANSPRNVRRIGTSPLASGSSTTRDSRSEVPVPPPVVQHGSCYMSIP